MHHRRTVLSSTFLFHKNLDGGSMAVSFLFILAFLISLLTPLNTARSADIIWVQVYSEDFSRDVFSNGDWVRSDTSVNVDTVNGWLQIKFNSYHYDDNAQKAIILGLPIAVEARMKLEKNWVDWWGYRLPDLGILYGEQEGEGIGITYLPGDDPKWGGWAFKEWTHIHTMAPESENVWRTVKAIIRSDGGELWAKADSDTVFTLITASGWSIPDSILRIRFGQPWDADCDLDYITISICDTVPDSFSLISPITADSVNTPVILKWRKAIDPDPNDTIRYDLYLSRNSSFNPDSGVVLIYDSLLDTTFTDSLDMKTWYWKVKAYDKWGAVRWSNQSWSFYANSRPNSYSLTSPLDNDSLNSPVTLNWQTAVDPDNDLVRYDLYLSRSVIFNPDSTLTYDSLFSTTFIDSLDAKRWYWKVKAYDKWGAVTWSNQSWSFYVNSHPNSYSLITPTNADSVKTRVRLKWHTAIDPDNDPVRYFLYFSRTPSFTPDSIVYGNLLDTTFIDSTDFLDSSHLRLWHWKVKAYDKWGALRWSDQTWSFWVYLCGDVNADSKVTVSDVVSLINFLFKGGPASKPYGAGEVNCDGYVTVADVVYLVNYLFKGGPMPCKNCP